MGLSEWPRTRFQLLAGSGTTSPTMTQIGTHRPRTNFADFGVSFAAQSGLSCLWRLWCLIRSHCGGALLTWVGSGVLDPFFLNFNGNSTVTQRLRELNSRQFMSVLSYGKVQGKHQKPFDGRPAGDW